MSELSARFLRSPELRAALYVHADGKCQDCGCLLGEGWHADHIQPWSVSHRTNVFEMQALCAACNVRKGGKPMPMPRLSKFQFNKKAFRSGQLGAFETIVKRVMQDRERHTTIVLPTRYGKTDVMLMSGLHLVYQQAVSSILIMTPNQVLRNQAVDREKLETSLRRYAVAVERILPDGSRRPGIDPYNVDGHPSIEHLLNLFPLAATTSMVMHNIATFRHWVDYLKQSYGVPPVVLVDEAHTASDQTAWGNTIHALSSAGAYIVLCTATPYRSDGRPIPGFEVTKTYADDLTKRQQVGAHIYQEQHGRRVVYTLTAHHTTSFQQAWQESVICGITRESFNVDLREHGIEGYIEQWLSELPPGEARRALSKAVRSPVVIQEGVRILLRNLRIRRKDAPETAGIVFVGNDDARDTEAGDNDVEANRYANLVADIIREEGADSPGERPLKAVIATSSVDAAAQVIEDFGKGKGDILIVKMMASAGLDIARLKVELDLSTVRTAGSFVQRVMRVCTRWERDDRAPVLKALYITPDDGMGRELYQRLIHDLGGDASTAEWDDDTLLREGGSTKRSPRPLTEYEAIGTSLGNVLEDEDGTVGPGKLGPIVDKLMDQLPYTTREVGKGRVSNAIQLAVEEAKGVQDTDSLSARVHVSTPDADGLVDNTQQRMEIKRTEVVRLVKQEATHLMWEAHGRRDQELFSMEVRDTWNWLYEQAGIRRFGKKSGQILKSLDEADLDRLTQILREESHVGTH